MVNFFCLNCGYSTILADELASQKMMCPKCKTKGRVDSLDVDPGTTQVTDDKDQIKFEMIGVQDTLRVYVDKVSITPKGILGFLNKGFKGTKEIPYRSIVAIQIKEAGAMFNGFLQFTIPGGNESRGGLLAAVKDENTFMFSGVQNNALAHQIKGFIQWEIDRLNEPQPQSVPTQPTISDELSRLAELRAKGVLSDDEFSALKKRLIGIGG